MEENKPKKIMKAEELKDIANPNEKKVESEFDSFNNLLKNADKFGGTILSIIDKYEKVKKYANPEGEKETGQIANKFEKGKAQGFQEGIKGTTKPLGTKTPTENSVGKEVSIKINEEKAYDGFKEFANNLIENLDNMEGMKLFKNYLETEIKDKKISSKVLINFKKCIAEVQRDISEQLQNPMLKPMLTEFIKNSVEVEK